MVDRTKPTAEPIVPRPAIGDDDPRAARHRTAYEDRMGAEGSSNELNDEQRELAKEDNDKAVAAHEVAVEEFNAAQEALLVAKANLYKTSNAYAKFGPNARPLTPAETLSPGEETCLMVFPHVVTLQASVTREDGTITGTRSATFQEGIQEVPVSLQNHPYLVSHNVLPYSGSRLEGKGRDPRYNDDLTRNPPGGDANDPRNQRYRGGEGNTAEIGNYRYQGDPITSFRTARASDEGFVQGADQVLVQINPTTRRVVARSEVTKI